MGGPFTGWFIGHLRLLKKCCQKIIQNYASLLALPYFQTIFKDTPSNLLNSVSIFKIRTEFVLSHGRNDCAPVFDLKGG